MGGGDQVSSLKQFVQFGLDKQMAVGGALFELESIRAVPDAPRIGWWTMEWWWDQPGVPHVAEFNAAMKKITGGAATARNWFGYASVQTFGLDRQPGEDARRAEARPAPCRASSCRRRSRCSRARRISRRRPRTDEHGVRRRGAPAEGRSRDKMFTVRSPVPGEKAAGSVEDTGCKIQPPA